MKKLKKLCKHPGKFFSDFWEKRRVQLFPKKNRKGASLVPGSKKSSRRYSIVSAVYNVDKYLDQYFNSLVSQTLDFSTCIELIMVDDGSSDRSARTIRKWQKKYPKSIKYIKKENGGQASARNLGLSSVTGQWVTFIDPDDFLAQDYFEQIDRALEQQKSAPGLIASNLIFYHEQSKKFSDTHPLRYRFSKGTQTVDFSKSTNHIQMSVMSAFFDAEILLKSKLRFDEKVKPSFEDAHYVNAYLMHVIKRPSVFVSAAKYYYRKRADGTSTLDTAWEKEGTYTDVLEHGVLALMRMWAARTGTVPVFVQRVALYHLMWYFRKLVNNDRVVAFLGLEKREKFRALMFEIFSYIDKTTIDKFDLAGIWFMHRVGLFSTFKKSGPSYQIVYVGEVDERRNVFQLKYFTPSLGFESFRLDDKEVDPVFATSRVHTFLGSNFVEERIVWLPIRKDSTLSVQLELADVRISFNKGQHKSVLVADIVAQSRSSRLNSVKPGDIYVRMMRRLSKSNWAKKKYHDGWLLMDRESQADDNAEHLYRYLQREKPEINAYFALSRSSSDWRRLKGEGFRLISFGGWRHKILMLNCEHFISSHADQYFFNLTKRVDYGDILKYRFTFLQHGVIKDDLADLLNQKNIDCFVTSAPRECSSIESVGSRYKFSSREVVLSGLPRHDKLLGMGAPGKTIVIMPTWRLSLAGKKDGTIDASRSGEFIESSYFREWAGLLSDEGVSRIVKEFGYRIVFYLHANMQPYSDLFKSLPHVEVCSHKDGSLQDVFETTSILITDYSSVAFDVALMKRSVIYFQFDRDEFFSGGHAYQKGYFDYEKDGFGPVCESRGELLDQLNELLKNGAKMAPVHEERVERFFVHWDGRNSERTFRAISSLDGPVPASELSSDDLALAIDQARLAGKWHSVVERGDRLLTLNEGKSHGDLPILLSRANRKLGNTDAALEILAAIGIGPIENIEVEIEYAKIFSSRADWVNAARKWASVISLISKNDEIWIQANRSLFEALMKSEQHSEALNIGVQFSGSFGEDIVASSDFLKLIHVAMKLERPELAELFASRVISSTPAPDVASRGKVLAILASIAKLRGEQFKALGMWSRALRLVPSEGAYSSEFESSLSGQEEWEIGVLEDAIAESHARENTTDPVERLWIFDPIDSAVLRSILLRKRGNVESSRQIVEELLIRFPLDALARLEAGEIALAERNWKRALQIFEGLSKTDPGKKIKRVARGLLISRVELSMFKDIGGMAAGVHAEYPLDLEVNHAYALSASFEKRWQDAYRGWSFFMEKAPAGAGEYQHAGTQFLEALLNLERLDEAQGVCAKLLEVSPSDFPLLKKFAEISTRLGDWALGASAWRDAERHSRTLDERRYCARMQAVALWWSGDRLNARLRLSHEIHATAFNLSLEALKKGNVAEALDQLSYIAIDEFAAQKNSSNIDNMTDRHRSNDFEVIQPRKGRAPHPSDSTSKHVHSV